MGASGALTERGSRSSHSSIGSGKPTLAIVIPIHSDSAGLQFARPEQPTDTAIGDQTSTR